MRRGGAASNEGGGVLHQFVGEAMAELTQLEENVHAADIKAAVKILAAAREIHVLAQRRAFPIASYLAYALNQLELNARLLDGLGGMLYGFASGIARGDALLVASFSHYSPEVIDIARASRERGVRVVAITDSALSPLKPVANVCFELGDDSKRPLRSLVGPLCLAQALVVSTGHHLAAAAAKPARKSARRAT